PTTDDHSYPSSVPHARLWLLTDTSPLHVPKTSYQSGGIPAFSTFFFKNGTLLASQEQQNPWETQYGLRVDVLAAIAYILGPVSALTLLVLETCNDYVCFHAYKLALLMMPLIFMFFTLLLILPQGFMHGLVHFHLPSTDFLAKCWLAEE
ncbi:hypothetical protein L208DRAFT_1405204, partial [Tricholoma matsutake]